jgi:esterase
MKQLNYQQQGTGKHVLLIHGLFGSLENLNMVAKVLSEQYCVTSVDVRNHGGSFHENGMSYPLLAQDVINLLDHLDIQKTDVLGHSMGGKIGMQIALDFPDRVNRLIIADISPVSYPAHHLTIIEGLQSIDLSKIIKRSDADLQLAQYVDNKGIRQFLLRNLAMTKATNGVLSFSFKCSLTNISKSYSQIMEGYLGDKKFSGDTLFIKGGDSDYIQPQHKKRITTLLPNSKVKIIQGAGHWLHAEKTVAFNKIVSDFLSKQN